MKESAANGRVRCSWQHDNEASTCAESDLDYLDVSTKLISYGVGICNKAVCIFHRPEAGDFVTPYNT